MSAQLKYKTDRAIDLREEPDIQAQVQIQVPLDSELTLIDGADEWIFVNYQDQQNGWVYILDLPGLNTAFERGELSDFTPLINPEAFFGLEHAVRGIWGDGPELNDVYARFSDLAQLADPLLRVAKAVHAFLNGNPVAEIWLISVLETGIYTLGPISSFPLANMQMSLSRPGFPVPRFPDLSATPCLVQPLIYSRLVQGLRSLGQRIDPNNSDETFERLLQQLNPNFLALEAFDTLFASARLIGNGTNTQDFEQAFWNLTVTPISSGGGGALPLPIPTPGSPRPTDPCMSIRWDTTERMSRCFCSEYYQISQIRFTSPDGREHIGVACPDGIIEIQGAGFRDTRDWGLGDERQSEVIFSGIGSSGVPAREYPEWNDTTIRVRVPAGASDGLVNLRIICDGTNVSDCGLIFRQPAPVSTEARTLKVVTAPTIEWFGADYTAAACIKSYIQIRVLNAEEVRIIKDDGSILPFDAGAPGDLRNVAGYIEVTERETITYTLQAMNLCGTATQTGTIERRQSFSLYAYGESPSPTKTGRAGESVSISLNNFCTPAEMGLGRVRFFLDFEDPDNVLVDPPVEVVLESDVARAVVSIDTRTACGEVTVTARPEDPTLYDLAEAQASISIYDTPRITSVRLIDRNACLPAFRAELIVDCLSSREDRPGSGFRNDLQVLMVNPPDTDEMLTGSYERVLSIEPGEERSNYGVRVLFEISQDTVTFFQDRYGRFRAGVFISQFGLNSNILTLDAGFSLLTPDPLILEFSTSLTRLDGSGRFVDNALTYRVLYARRVEIRATGGDPRRIPDDLIHSESGPPDRCEEWSSSSIDRINSPVTYELTATGWNGETVSRTRVIDYSTSPPPPGGDPPPIRGIRRMTIWNCDYLRDELIVYTRQITPPTGWIERGRIPTGLDTFGDCPGPFAQSLEISFDEGVHYELRLTVRDVSTVYPIIGDADGACYRYHFGRLLPEIEMCS